MSQGPNLVLDWLSRLDLTQYVEAFLDNGYDDLEVCKKIGEPDLDAIGVCVEHHRHRLLDAVRQLRDSERRQTQGYYFTLEPRQETGNQRSPFKTAGGTHRAAFAENFDPRARDCTDFVMYPKLKLKVLIRHKLARDGIDLGEAPYSHKDGSAGTLEDLAQEYSRYYGTYVSDVCERMEELRRRRLVKNPDVKGKRDSGVSSLQLCSQIQEPRGLCSTLSTPETNRKFPACKFSHSDDGSGGGKWDGKKKVKSFWNTFRKTPKGASECHLVQGDLVGFVASEITMSDEERIQLMMMVKENMISIEEALARLKEFETQARQECSPERSEGADASRSAKESLSDNLCQLSVAEPEERQAFSRLHKILDSTRKAKNKLVRTEQKEKEEQCQPISCSVDEDFGLETAGHPGGSSPSDENAAKRGNTVNDKHHHHSKDAKMSRSLTDGGLRHRLLNNSGRACSFGGFDLTNRSASAGQNAVGLKIACNCTFKIKLWSFFLKLSLKGEEGVRSPQIPRVSLGKKVKSVRETVRKHINKRYQAALSDQSSRDGISSCPQSPHLNPCVEKAKLKPGGSVESLRSSLSGHSSMSGRTAGTADWFDNNRESVKLEDGEEDEPAYCGPFCGRALVHTDFTPSPYDADSLKLKCGDVIDVISKPPVGTWMGMLRGKVGTFKFVYVEVLEPELAKPEERRQRCTEARLHKAQSLEQLLERLHLQEHLPALLFNGYDDLDAFRLLEEEDLDELLVSDPQHRALLLAAARLLSEYEGRSIPEPVSLPDGEGLHSDDRVLVGDSPRDSGCFESSDLLENMEDSGL
ncbi:SAM and SH3 domain-containing protein 1-like isoform X2 [Stigmatopora nigra]